MTSPITLTSAVEVILTAAPTGNAVELHTYDALGAHTAVCGPIPAPISVAAFIGSPNRIKAVLAEYGLVPVDHGSVTDRGATWHGFVNLISPPESPTADFHALMHHNPRAAVAQQVFVGMTHAMDGDYTSLLRSVRDHCTRLLDSQTGSR